MSRTTVFVVVAMSLVGVAIAASDRPRPPVDKEPVAASPAPVSTPASSTVVPPTPVPRIQIAMLLDTSSSMDGLINQTREQLWRIVTTFATAKKDGQTPKLELALYQYGNDSIREGRHFVQRLLPLTSDLDRVSEALFKLTTNGGEEYCGAVISHALTELEWSTNPKDLKLIYIAGNEAFTQGPIRFTDIVKQSIQKGIVVNTIFAGDEQAGISEGWAQAPKLADGQYMAIDMNKAVVQIAAPQDAVLSALSDKLNKTYVAFGAQRKEAPARQAAQDSKADAAGASTKSKRIAAKASALYRNAAWDLVDAKKEGRPVSSVAADELPEEMRSMDAPQREAYVAEKAAERAAIQAEITKVSAERDAYVAGETKKQASAGGRASMDDALIQSAKQQAGKAAFSF
jgi:hypothetical protein